jgi:hypothetical protein
MFFIGKDNLLKHSYRLDDIHQRTLAAQDLGKEVVLIADDAGLHIKYQDKVPEIPWSAK